MPEQHEIIQAVSEYALLDPESLLPQHRQLLDTNFDSLGLGPTPHRLLWLSDMDSALAASSLSQCGTLTPAAREYFSTA